MTKKTTEKKHYLRTGIIFFIILIISTGLYARYIGTTGLNVKEYIITHDKLTSNFDGLKIVHFADLHYGTTVFLPEVEHMVEKFNSLRPDIIVFTGDLIDIHYDISEESLDNLIAVFNKIESPIASFMVRGNHDQGDAFTRIAEETDFRLLVNEHELFFFGGDTPLAIVGLDDPYSGNQDINAAFEGLNEEYYSIVIAHQPDVFNQLGDLPVDLFLAGHSHGGGIRLPFIGSLIRNYGSSVFHNAHYQIGNTEIFVSSGIGTGRYPFRLFNRPSINFYRFSAQ